jgi:cell division protein FtsI (penicillin-binding protein 3)
VNNPAITVAVILDSPVGLHQGGQVSAPVFQRVAQQVLAYFNVPHDVELPANRPLLLASRKLNSEDLEESSPDHLGSALETAENAGPETLARSAPGKASPVAEPVIPAALRQTVAPANASHPQMLSPSATSSQAPVKATANGTVVLDVEEGGIAVPSFLGKSVRAAIEAAEDNGLELEAIGSGIAHEQSPQPGTHVATGARIVVRFDR